MLLDAGVTSGMRLEQILSLAKIAQSSDLNGIWIGDDISNTHDVFTIASLVLLKNSKLKVGIGITSPKIRNITTIARASIGLSQIGAAGRFRLGLGVGGLKDLKRLGIIARKPENLLGDAATLLRGIWKGETLDFQSSDYRLKRYKGRYSPGHGLPIFFGVRGPKLLRLAGETADGIILSGPIRYLEKAIGIVKKALGNRQPDNFSFVAWIPTILTQKPSNLRLVKRTVVFVLRDTPRRVLEMGELDYAKIGIITKTYERHGLSKASELVTNDLLDEIAIWGDAEQVCNGLDSLQKFKVNEAVFGPPYGFNPERALTKLARTWGKFA